MKKCDCWNTELDIFTQTDWDGDTEFVVMCQRCKKLLLALQNKLLSIIGMKETNMSIKCPKCFHRVYNLPDD